MTQTFEQHAMAARPRHDERERQAFVGALRGHLARRVMPGNYAVYRERVEPAFLREHGRPPRHHAEIRPVMERDPYYQFWSAMQRCSQQLMWDAVIDAVEPELPRLGARAEAKGKAARKGRTGRGRQGGRRGSLRLDPSLPLPRYHAAVDIHLQPGGYHGGDAPDALAAGAIYDHGLHIYSHGSMGPRNEYLGELLLEFFRQRHPDGRPRRILDMGCAIGNSTLPWARAFPRARVEAIDVAAPQLRYGHARAEAMGVPVHFSQQDAERTDFPDGSFDLVLSHIMLHETSRGALSRILGECRRLLRPGGLMLHLEIPRGRTVFENFLYNWESWNNNETFGQYMTHIDLAALAQAQGFEDARVVEHAVRRDPEQRLYSEETSWKVLSARR